MVAFWNRDEGESEDQQPTDTDDVNIDQIIRQKEQEIAQTRDRIEAYRDEYRKRLKMGAQTDSPVRRRVFAIQARIGKFKGNIQKIKQMKAMRDVSKLTLAQGQSEIRAMIDDLEMDPAVEEAVSSQPSDFQDGINDVQATIQADLEEITETMEGMDVELAEMDMMSTEEEEIMEELAAGESDPAEFDDLDFEQDSDSGNLINGQNQQEQQKR